MSTSRIDGVAPGSLVPMQRGAAAVGATPNREVPPAARPRLVGVDATRGVALLGMMAVHALYALSLIHI